jgi:hypothetical protein
MLLIDAHVHIYDCFDLNKFLNSAYSNFKSAAKRLDSVGNFSGILLLAETSKDDWFNRLYDYADGRQLPDNRTVYHWSFQHTDEHYSLIAKFNDVKKLLLIAGRQILTAENIEVLALCTSDRFDDGLPILYLINKIKEKNGLAVIPWGVGKWFGNRGRMVADVIGDDSSLIYLGDNGNRPRFWMQPTLFKLAERKGIKVLPGSDPLPFLSESRRAGSYGFIIDLQIDLRRPGRIIKQILRDPDSAIDSTFGKLEKSYRFFLTQLRMQIAKRYSNTKQD